MTISQSFASGLKILFLYDNIHTVFTVSEIVEQLGYTLSKTYRLVRTLTAYGFLSENSEKGKYSLGLSALKIGLFAKQNFQLLDLSRPLMEELAALTKETVILTAVNGTRGICLDRVESDQPIRFSRYHPGTELPLHCGASTKALMAHLPEAEWDQIILKEGLKTYTPNTITDIDQLKTHLREIRKQGFALSDEEVTLEVRAAGAPIFNTLGELAGGLGIAGPAYRISKDKMYSLSKWAVMYAEKISARIGYVRRQS